MRKKLMQDRCLSELKLRCHCMRDIEDNIRTNTRWETMEDYKKECEKRKARSEKFGTQYVEPKLEDFLPWTEVKRIRDAEKKGDAAMPKGFATGIDLTDAGELAKQEARKARFEKGGGPHAKSDETEDDADISEHKDEDSKPTPSAPHQDLPVTECWDKEEMLRPMRSDPPAAMWIKPLDGAVGTGPAVEESDKEMESHPVDKEMNDAPTWLPEKIHLCSIDWAAFKQIRNKDLMAYFTDYGPTYVEWLGDLSCNVCFEDQHTARRALMTLGQEIPSPPPPPQEITEYDTASTKLKEVPDLGNMTWRFCLRPIRKVANDKHGRKGTTARVLMRSALSTDILQERPNTWPAPPGGFSSTKVLGPNSDYKGGKKKSTDKKKRKSVEPRDSYMPHTDMDSEHPMLGRGLSSGRQGFSIGELEQERAMKKAKTIDE